MKKVFDQLWGREILNDAKVVLALTPVESQQYEKMGVDPDKIRIIPNGIDTSIQNMVSSGNFRKDYSLNNDEKIILFLGRLHKIKGIDLLVEAFNDLVTELDEVRLVIAGPDDGCLRFLEKMVKDYEIEDKVLFTGPLYDNKKYEAYIDADVYVLPSRYETFPNTVLESAIFRTPVIVTDRCGIADLVEDNMGLVVKWDKESLKEGICSLIMDEKRGNEFGDKGKFFVSENLDSTIVARKIENLYKSIIKN
ncbi:glycosyltransferase [Methanobacterium petrolearium]|nr:hypothetical protein GCM10025861_21650 [Methanobacterium petrolearium]